jgi:hypothetical protein
MNRRVTRTGAAALLCLGLGATGQAAEGPPEALALVDAMIAAHGGMEAWAAAPTVSWEDEFRSGDGEAGEASRVTVEQGRRRAYLDVPGTDTSMAWDGQRAWSRNWTSSAPPRFMALLNYHFLNLPWLVRDPGVNLSAPGEARLWARPEDTTLYRTVKITYDQGTGDTPDDYYLLFIDPQTHRLVANEYIVTYEALLPEGIEHTPPHLLVYDEHTSVGGLVVPSRYTIYEEGESGVFLYASCDIRDWSFSRPFDASRMEMPEDAVIDQSKP